MRGLFFANKIDLLLFGGMQTVTRGANNVLVFTLTERVTLSSPVFLMRVQSRSTNQIKRFILPANQSSETARYDQFTITETSGSEILTSGTVTLTAGDWNYEIYEQSSSSNLLETSSTTLLEKGILRVLGTTDTYKDPEQTDTFIDA